LSDLIDIFKINLQGAGCLFDRTRAQAWRCGRIRLSIF